MRFRIAVMVAAAALAFGVLPARAQMQGGVKAGVNFANVNFEGDISAPDFDNRMGFIGGLFVVFPLGPSFGVQTEALYTQAGAEFEENGATAKLKLDYLDIPVLLRFSTQAAGSTSGFHVFAGPAFAFKMSAKTKIEFEGESMDEDIDDETEGTDIGLVVGAGFNAGRLIIDGRYRWGLSNLNKEDSDAATIKNRAFAVMAGFRF